jgi:uncharacterized protein YdeI (YjbR/CyaY-like superfamily)
VTAKGIPTARFAQIAVANALDLPAWLAAHHAQDENIWLVTWKVHVADKYVSVADILDAVIAFGWIDGIRRKLDDDRTLQIIGPRRTTAWAQSYKDRAARLIAEGRMMQPGLDAIAASRANGLWDYWADVDALIVPDDLARALATCAGAAAGYDAGPPSYRRNLLRWLKLAKTGTTRSKRIASIVDAAATGARIPQM